MHIKYSGALSWKIVIEVINAFHVLRTTSAFRSTRTYSCAAITVCVNAVYTAYQILLMDCFKGVHFMVILYL